MDQPEHDFERLEHDEEPALLEAEQSAADTGANANALPQIDTQRLGETAGLGAGMLAGARLGSMVIPVPVVGTFVGALVGGVLGSAVGQRIVPATINAATTFVKTLTEAPSDEGRKTEGEGSPNS